MPWNGSGTFSRKTTSVSPATSGTTIDADEQNTYTADVTSGINACLAKNGENAATGDLPMGGYNHTNVDDGTARTEYASVGQMQDGENNYAADSGAADAYVITLSPAITAYSTGMAIRFKSSADNTGASTINVNGVGAKAIKYPDGSALKAGAIKSGGTYTLVYDGTNMVLQSEIKTGVFVDEGDGPYVSATAFDIDGSLTIDTWETVGPTGGGATNTWAALDSVPTDADWIEVSCYIEIQATATTIGMPVYARDSGGSAAIGRPTQIAVAWLSDGTSNAKLITTVNRSIKIPVTSAIFELHYATTGSPTITSELYLTGYGYNGA